MAYLVTGAMGCLGAWSLHHLVKAGKKAVSFDLSDNRSRVDLLLSADEQQAITYVKGDLTQFDDLLRVIKEHEITHIIHLAALQVPFCRANPVLGAQVNVTGTVNVFEAARQAGIKHLAFASSVAVYGTSDEYPGLIADDSPYLPHTLYGVYKVANEGTAKIFWQDHQISSICLRPYTVYGVARDQGVTSETTKAMLTAAAGKSYHVSFGGRMQFHFASDVAHQFIEAAETSLAGAFGFNPGGDVVAVADVVTIINELRPDASITNDEKPLPFPEGADGTTYRKHLNTVMPTPLREGIQQTIEHFETLLAQGRIKVE